jgi:hypothetical protein
MREKNEKNEKNRSAYLIGAWFFAEIDFSFKRSHSIMLEDKSCQLVNRLLVMQIQPITRHKIK